jgi:hypothetical protein
VSRPQNPQRFRCQVSRLQVKGNPATTQARDHRCRARAVIRMNIVADTHSVIRMNIVADTHSVIRMNIVAEHAQSFNGSTLQSTRSVSRTSASLMSSRRRQPKNRAVRQLPCTLTAPVRAVLQPRPHLQLCVRACMVQRTQGAFTQLCPTRWNHWMHC